MYLGSEHASGMHQYARKSKFTYPTGTSLTNALAWTNLEAEGQGCNLQHYNPLIDAHVSGQ
jgi:predicted oxidoreductase (fatty acid repression mutant protein)